MTREIDRLEKKKRNINITGSTQTLSMLPQQAIHERICHFRSQTTSSQSTKHSATTEKRRIRFIANVTTPSWSVTGRGTSHSTSLHCSHRFIHQYWMSIISFSHRINDWHSVHHSTEEPRIGCNLHNDRK
jgi:hypothetical protein